MWRRVNEYPWTAVMMLALVLPGCGAEETPATTEQAPVQEQVGSTELPEGHPPTRPPAQTTGLPEVSPTAGTGGAGLTWTAPPTWNEEAPSSSMRRAQYRIPSESGDGQCVVFYFGPGQGGDIDSNVNRWADEFEQSDGSSSRDLMTRREMDVGGVPVTVVEVTGSHSGGMSPMAGGGQKKEGQMLIGAIASGPDANWFFKCTGPEMTMRFEAEAIEGMLRSLRSGVGT